MLNFSGKLSFRFWASEKTFFRKWLPKFGHKSRLSKHERGKIDIRGTSQSFRTQPLTFDGDEFTGDVERQGAQNLCFSSLKMLAPLLWRFSHWAAKISSHLFIPNFSANARVGQYFWKSTYCKWSFSNTDPWSAHLVYHRILQKPLHLKFLRESKI